jgi:hypothetical protein
MIAVTGASNSGISMVVRIFSRWSETAVVVERRSGCVSACAQS